MFDALYKLLMDLHPFIQGFSAALCMTAGLLFFRFYRRTRDRLFLFFSAAFLIQSTNRFLFLLLKPDAQESTPLYLIRLLSFGLILYAIVDKNRARKAP